MRALRGAGEAKVKVDHLSFFYDRFQALHEVTFDIPERRITAIIGPSGCGKSTLLRVFNRMYDLVPKAHASFRDRCTKRAGAGYGRGHET